MRRPTPRLIVVALLALLLVTGSAPVLAAGDGAAGPRDYSGETSLTTYGTAWVPEARGAFGNRWKPYGWGVEASVKPARAPGYQWVHIPVSYMCRAEGRPLSLDWVQFCAESSNGVATRPTDIHLWEGTLRGPVRFYTGTVNWAPNNDTQCWLVDVPNQARVSLGISVRVYFANSTDTIRLYQATARVVGP